MLVWVTVAGVAVVLLCLRLDRRMSSVVFALLALVLVVGDLFQAGMGYNPAIPQSHAVQPVTPAIRFLQAQRPARFVAVTPYAEVNPLPPDVNMRYGLYDLRGYDLPVITQFGNLWQRYVAPPTPLLPLDTPSVPLTITDNLTPQALKVLALFGVRDVMADPKAPVLHIDGLHVVYSGADATIYADRNALPRSWVVSDQIVVGSEIAPSTKSWRPPSTRCGRLSPNIPSPDWRTGRRDPPLRWSPVSPPTAPNESSCPCGPDMPARRSCPTPTTPGGRPRSTVDRSRSTGSTIYSAVWPSRPERTASSSPTSRPATATG